MKKRDVVLRGAIAVAFAVLGYVVLFWRPNAIRVHEHVTSSKPDAVRILFVGNSHTFVNDLPGVFGKLAHAAHPDRPLVISDVTAGGVSLADHLKDGTAARTIASGRWDWVVVQEQSGVPGSNPAQFEDSLCRFAALIRAAHAMTVLYEVWPHRGDPFDDIEYQRAAYVANVGLLANVGTMWMQALARDPKLELYQRDDHHAAPAGTYLAACVILHAVFNERCDGLPTFGLVTPQVAAEIQSLFPRHDN